ncbi:hypothetical protein ACN28C_24380 [Plantactinospora sp. WMMC1484]|uniref:hypothetical protein n=1 Tax=Plantactinospora sp. WMMC1484 TaxID=3404122 RepID=UPI003BF4ABAF
MRDIHDLRQALDAETADLTVHMPAELIRRRAHRLRMRRTAVAAAAVVVAAVASTATLVAGAGPAADVAGPGISTAECPGPTGDPMALRDPLGPLTATGAVLDVPDVPARYDVLTGLTGTSDAPGLVVVFRDRRTGIAQVWDTRGLARDPGGDLAGKRAGDPPHQFVSGQLALGPHRVLDVGLYTRVAHRITVASEGRGTDAVTTRSAVSGWTLFWVQRDATPLPPDRFETPGEYQGPERVTVTAYDHAGRAQHTVTGGPHVGGSVQNPRDGRAGAVGGATPSATPSPNTCPASSRPNEGCAGQRTGACR